MDARPSLHFSDQTPYLAFQKGAGDFLPGAMHVGPAGAALREGELLPVWQQLQGGSWVYLQLCHKD